MRASSSLRSIPLKRARSTGDSRMRTRSLVYTILLVLGAAAVCWGQPASSGTARSALQTAERELKGFYDSYAEDLRLGRRESIAARYDPRGAFNLGNARKSFKSLEEIKKHYLGAWNAPKNFTWKELTIDVLSPDSAVVMAIFEWQTASGTALDYSYTGVLTRQNGKWLIRVEDESRGMPPPAKPSAQSNIN
jgi:hypothetical protein